MKFCHTFHPNIKFHVYLELFLESIQIIHQCLITKKVRKFMNKRACNLLKQPRNFARHVKTDLCSAALSCATIGFGNSDDI